MKNGIDINNNLLRHTNNMKLSWLDEQYYILTKVPATSTNTKYILALWTHAQTNSNHKLKCGNSNKSNFDGHYLNIQMI
jgi:hypothetical protein